MQIDQKDVAIKLVLIFIIVLTLGPLVTGCTSAAEKKEYRDAQVKVISTQVDARAKENSASAAARIALYAAMAEVARTSPDSADAIAVAMAVSSVREESASPAGIVQLRPEQNEALELAKAISPALIQTVGTVAVAGYQASVSKNNSDNAALVALGESGKDADIMRSVTAMGTAALSRQGISVAGNYNEAGGNIDQSTSTLQSTETTATTTTTTTTSEQNNMSTTDSNNVYTTADGTMVSIADIEALIANGIQVTVVIDGEEVQVSQCEDQLTFGGGCTND
jgi:hypothetical protein